MVSATAPASLAFRRPFQNSQCRHPVARSRIQSAVTSRFGGTSGTGLVSILDVGAPSTTRRFAQSRPKGVPLVWLCTLRYLCHSRTSVRATGFLLHPPRSFPSPPFAPCSLCRLCLNPRPRRPLAFSTMAGGGPADGTPSRGSAVPGNTTAAATTAAAPLLRSGLISWVSATMVICVPCETAIADSTQFKHHLATSAHKVAWANSLAPLSAGHRQSEGSVARARLLAGASSSVDECKKSLKGPVTDSQEGVAARYKAASWPLRADDPHLSPVPGLRTFSGYGCYICGTGSPDLRRLQKQHTHKAGDEASMLDYDEYQARCSNQVYTIATLQSLQRGNKTCWYPVKEVPAPGAAASHDAPGTAATVLPLEAFLGAPGEGDTALGDTADPSCVLPTSEETTASQSGGLMQLCRFDSQLAAFNWTAASVIHHFGPFTADCSEAPPAPDSSAVAYKAQGAFFFACVKAAVFSGFDSALAFVRSCDLTVASRLRIGKATAADTVSHRPFNVRVTRATVAKYARDVAVFLYFHMSLVGLQARSEVDTLEDGRLAPDLGAIASALATKVQTKFESKAHRVVEAVRAKRATQPQYAADRDDAALVALTILVDPVTAVLRALFHEVYDPRPPAVGGTGKSRSDVGMLLPFLAVVYPSVTAAAAQSRPLSIEAAALFVRYMDATAAQHLAGAFIFGTHIANALHLMKEEAPTAERSYEQIAALSNPSSDTTTACIVQLYAHGENIGRAEQVAPAFLPCEHPEDLDRAVPTAICGSLLIQGLHLSTVTLGKRATSTQARLYEDLRSLLCGHDPKESGFFVDAKTLVDVPNRQSPGVSVLQLRENRALVRRFQAHMVASGVLESPDCPVRQPKKRVVDSSGGGGQHLEYDRAAPPVPVANGAKLAAWLERVEFFRAELWALTHIVGGAPARQTERAAINICPSAARARRSLYHYDGLVYTALTYDKGQVDNQGVGRPIARFIDEKG